MSGISIILSASCLAMLIAWLVQQRTRDAGVVDVFWAFGMMLAGLYFAFTGAGPTWLRVILAGLTVTWFARLGLHILIRMLNGSEDGRYQAMRQWLGGRANLGFLLFFQLQAGFLVLLSLPFAAVANTTEPRPAMVALGLAVALTAFLGEVSADRQLSAFRVDPANQGLTCREGWWRYSRHPNYFFEWLHWFAYPLMGYGGPYAYWLWLSPLVVLLFLVFFTGIPFAEQQALRSRGANYRAYQAQTSVFFPWPPSNTRS